MLSIVTAVVALLATAEAAKLYGCAVSVILSTSMCYCEADPVPGYLYRQSDQCYRMFLKQQQLHLLLRVLHGDRPVLHDYGL